MIDVMQRLEHGIEWSRPGGEEFLCCSRRCTGPEGCAANLERLPAAIGDQRFVKLLIAARDLAARLVGERIDPCFGDFWTAIVHTLPTARVVPTEAGIYGTVQQARLWSEEVEVAAAPRTRHRARRPRVKDECYQLRATEVSLQNLHLGHVTVALRMRGLTTRRLPENLPGELGKDGGFQALWTLLTCSCRSGTVRTRRAARPSRRARWHRERTGPSGRFERSTTRIRNPRICSPRQGWRRRSSIPTVSHVSHRRWSNWPKQ